MDQTSVAVVEDSTATTTALKKSKNALKRELRCQYAKEKKRLKKAEKRASNVNHNAEPRSSTSNPEAAEARKRRRQEEDQLFHELCSSNYAVVIDCNFEDSHNDRAIASLTQQLNYCYGVNRRAKHPSCLYFTGMGSRTLPQFSKTGYNLWREVTVSSREFTEIDELKNRELVYLTADSDNLLESLDSKAAYIIGGIVDRNSLKGVTQQKAKGLAIKTARLPITESLSYKLSSSHVLTVNHVMSILKSYSESLSWEDAITQVIPERKAGGRETRAQRRTRNRNRGPRGKNSQDGQGQDDKVNLHAHERSVN